MKLQIDDIEQQDVLDGQQVTIALDRLNGQDVTMLRLEDNNGDYVQCIGTKLRMTIEYRYFLTSGFRHYVLGKGKDKSPLKVSWAIINTQKNEVRVHNDEILDLDDARMVFLQFYKEKSIPETLKKRNVTKLHQTGRRS